jgi:transcription elongation GreA/GreB family factor
VTRRRGRRRKKLLDDLKDRREYSHLKEEALYRTMWRKLLEEALDLSSDRILNE